tara:strand:+ start:172 stop:1089 length:918 start_codon:yes stop_codon:yes gene_type:complete
MANNKYYGYTPKSSKGNVGVPYGEDKRFINQNPFEFQKGMDYELTDLGCSRLAESTLEEREKATESVLKNLETHSAYYSNLIQYEVEYRNPVEGIKKPSFKTYLKEMEDYQMIEVDKKYTHDKMIEPKYKKEDYTVPYKTQALKEVIKREIRSTLYEKGKSPSGVEKTIKCCLLLKPCCPIKITWKKGEKTRGEIKQMLSKSEGKIGKKMQEAKKDEFDVEDAEPTRSQIKGIDKSIGDAKEALVNAMQKVKELGPDIKKLAKETNLKIKKNPAGKADYLQVYTSDPDVKEFLKLRKMLKSADLL